MARTPQDTFKHHLEALGAGDLDGMVADYSDDALLITPSSVSRGKDGVRQWFVETLQALGKISRFDVPTQVFEDDVLLIEWSADTDAGKVDAVDTFIFRDGEIRVQTVRTTIT